MAIKFNRAQTFATNGTVTSQGLHNLIDDTDIYQALITDQTAMTSVGSSDKLLIADADLTAADAPRSVTVNELFEDALTLSTYTNVKATNVLYTNATGNRTVSTSATITTGTIPNLTSSTANITLGTIPTLTAGTTTSTAANITSGTVQTLTASTATITTGTVSTLNSTTGTIGNLSTTLVGDFTISQGTGTLGITAVTAGSYGSVSAIPFITVDAKGRVTSATTGTFSSTPADGSITPAKLSQPFTSGTAVTSTSGTAIDFTGIPSWVKRITVMLANVSTSGASLLRMQLGVGGVATTTGYLGSCLAAVTGAVDVSTFSSGVDFSNLAADGDRKHGNVTFTNVTGGTWSFTGMTGLSNTGRMSYLSGSVPLSGTLNMVRVTTVGGSETFDNGTINIMYEG